MAANIFILHVPQGHGPQLTDLIGAPRPASSGALSSPPPRHHQPIQRQVALQIAEPARAAPATIADVPTVAEQG